MAALQGLLVRLGIACLPLLAVILLCVAMFSGLGRRTPVSGFEVQNALFPKAEAATLDVPEATKPVQAAFERLSITRATIRVPD